ncbi:MAG: hypothetical protein J6S67_00680 [Methanobrevibacter sp.]|nr:hypothetical protein [Methanobrevibacter sp.]
MDSEDSTGEITYTIDWNNADFQKYLKEELEIDDTCTDVLYYSFLHYIEANTADIEMNYNLMSCMNAGVDLFRIAHGIAPHDGEKMPYFKSLTIKAKWIMDKDKRYFSSFKITRIED